VADRVVQAALKLMLEPIFEADFVSVSYGFRPGSGGPGEFHPRAPTERSVTVSRHSALVILIISGYLTQAQWAKNRGYCVVTRSQAARAFRWARNR